MARGNKQRDKMPPVLTIGESVALYRVDKVAEFFHVTVAGLLRIMRALKVPPMHIGSATYVSLHALEKALFALSDFGGKGFTAPGSVYRMGRYYNIPPEDRAPCQLSAADVKEIQSKTVESRMAKAAGILQGANRKFLEQLTRAHKRSKEKVNEQGQDPATTADGVQAIIEGIAAGTEQDESVSPSVDDGFSDPPTS